MAKHTKNIDSMAWGLKEPIPSSGEITNSSELVNIYNWYNYNKTTKDAVNYLYNFLPDDTLKYIKRLPEWKIPPTLGWISRLKSFNINLPIYSEEFFSHKVNTLINDSKTIVFSTSKNITYRKKRIDKSGEIIGILEEALDTYFITNKFPDIKQILINNDIGPIISRKIIDFYLPQLDEPDISRNTEKFINEIIRLCGTRKRKVKKKTNKILTKDVKYVKIWGNVKSASPENIIGSKELFLYNYKNKRLFHITSEEGFIIDKSMVRNLSSCVYKIVSQEKVINNLSTLTKLRIRKAFKDIKRKPVENLTASKSTRLTDTTVIIKVY